MVYHLKSVEKSSGSYQRTLWSALTWRAGALPQRLGLGLKPGSGWRSADEMQEPSWKNHEKHHEQTKWNILEHLGSFTFWIFLARNPSQNKFVISFPSCGAARIPSASSL